MVHQNLLDLGDRNPMFSAAAPVVDSDDEKHKEKALNCPRCNSTNTKFCYYNNYYSPQQPRYLCKTCRRYWTEGGSLRRMCSLPSASASASTNLIKNSFTSEDHTLKATNISVYMTMDGSHETSADQSMVDYMIILDSGSPVHCTGDRSLLTDYCDEVLLGNYIRGASGKKMQVHGTGSINTRMFQVKDVLYVPALNNRKNVSKTIFSVSKLNDEGLSVQFKSDGSCFVIDDTKRTWNLKPKIVGEARKSREQFMVDYLRVPPNRDDPAEGPGILKIFLNASLSVWSSITGRVSQRTTCAQRPPV